MENIEQKVKNIISDTLNVDENEMIPNADLSVDLGANSLDIVEIIMAFEREFDIQISDEDAIEITTVQKAVDYIKKNMG